MATLFAVEALAPAEWEICWCNETVEVWFSGEMVYRGAPATFCFDFPKSSLQ